MKPRLEVFYRIAIFVPAELLKKIDRLAKEKGLGRSDFICSSLESRFIADEYYKADYAEMKALLAARDAARDKRADKKAMAKKASKKR
jgi:metal-responsive CopG/Arc/MetJ family transcriptional regulator